MRLLARLTVAAALLGPISAQCAVAWSTCQTINGVSNYLAYGNSVMMSLSPGISGCSPVGIPGAVAFTVGFDGVTTDNINSFLATGLTAYSTGHQVTILYDNSDSNCQGVIIAVGGYYGQCP